MFSWVSLLKLHVFFGDTPFMDKPTNPFHIISYHFIYCRFYPNCIPMLAGLKGYICFDICADYPIAMEDHPVWTLWSMSFIDNVWPQKRYNRCNPAKFWRKHHLQHRGNTFQRSIVIFPIYLCGSLPCTRSRPDLNIWFTRLTGPLFFCGAKRGFSPVHSRGLTISRCDWAILKWSLFFFWFNVGLPSVLVYFLTLQCHSAECAWAVFNPGPNLRSQKFRMDQNGHLAICQAKQNPFALWHGGIGVLFTQGFGHYQRLGRGLIGYD